MPKFVKKPVVIDAFIWTGGPDQMEDPPWICEAMENNDVWVTKRPSALLQLAIRTASGVVFASRGDYIIRGVDGEIYHCPPGVFTATYDRVTSEAQAVLAHPHEWHPVTGICKYCHSTAYGLGPLGDINHCQKRKDKFMRTEL